MKLRIALIFGFILAGIAGLALFSGGKSATVLVIDADRVARNAERFRNRDLRVRGFVKPGSVLRYGDKANFVLANEKGELKVRFDGTTQLPDAFSDGAPARADGRLDESGQLVAHKVEAKCASKYDAGHNDAVAKNPYRKQGKKQRQRLKQGKSI